jgi:hypothetical protein
VPSTGSLFQLHVSDEVVRHVNFADEVLYFHVHVDGWMVLLLYSRMSVRVVDVISTHG